MRAGSGGDSTYVCGPECVLNPNRDLTNKDTGEYFCQVSNGTGVQDHYIHLTVLGM